MRSLLITLIALLPVSCLADAPCPLDLAAIITQAQQHGDVEPPECAPFHYTVLPRGSIRINFSPPTNNFVPGHPLLEHRMEASSRFLALWRTNPAFKSAVQRAQRCSELIKLPEDLGYAVWRGRSGLEAKHHARNVVRHIGNAILASLGGKELGMTVADALSDEHLDAIDPAALESSRKELLAEGAQKPPGITDPAEAFLYCPGAEGNITILWRSKYGPQIRDLLQQPSCASLYADARAAFAQDLDRLDRNPRATTDARSAQLRIRMAPIVNALRKGLRSCSADHPLKTKRSGKQRK